MPMSGVLNWFGRYASSPAEPPRTRASRGEPVAPADAELHLIPEGPAPTWTPERLLTTDALWGDGYQFPGGEIETLRLAKPLGLSAASSLLLIGAGGGGPACSVATQLGAWVSGFESDPGLVASAVDRIAHRNLTKRAQIETWDPEEPNFRPHFYHHGLALQPLNGSQPERTLAAIAGALKPNGHLMMTEIVANAPLDPTDRTVAAWARLERRDPKRLPTEVQITRILGRLGFDVRVVEDVSERYMHQAMMGWRTVVRAMDNVRPSRREAMVNIQEAELWMIRLRLFQRGSLRLVRWHGIGGG
jgi:cyclopropane fatty-acyl-phospholipid synthase-like methyltransferase